MSLERRVQIIYAIFLCTLTACIMISAKITSFGFFTLTVGGFAYAITFPCTDIIAEVLGKEKARELVLLGIFAYVITTGFSYLAIKLPPAGFWAANQSAFETTLGPVPRIVLGSMAAYIVAQLHDVWAFHFWKRLTSGRFLWLRNNLSTMTSQLFDSCIFVTVAFAFTVPNDMLWKMVLGQYTMKLIIAAVDTPIVYLGVRWLRQGLTKDNGVQA